MKKFAVLMFAMLAMGSSIAQTSVPCSTCLPQGITFSTQSDVDSFQANNPGCTSISGSVIISGNGITNLNGLSVVTSIGGLLEIKTCSSLTSLAGLENLDSIGSYLYIHGNSSLANLSGLNHLKTVGAILWIEINPALTSIAGLSNLTEVHGNIDINYNTSLVSLSGLDNIDTAYIYGYYVIGNPSLSDCDVKSLCSWLASGTIFNQIHDNANGCNSPNQVKDACALLGVESPTAELPLLIYPNPASSAITVESNASGHLMIREVCGRQLLQRELTGASAEIDISGLKSGVYIVQVAGEKGVRSGKIIKL